MEILKRPEGVKGRPPKLSVADQLLMSLGYWREYRTLFHLAVDYGMSEPSASRIIRAVEDQLIQSGLFALPKTLPHRKGKDWDVVVVDATEVEIERPQKTAALLERQAQNAHPENAGRGACLHPTGDQYWLCRRRGS